MEESPRDMGWVEVVCGPMFSGKTDVLIQRLRRASYARQKVMTFKPAVDTRYAELEIVSHDRRALTALPVKHAAEILAAVGEDTQVVGVDEAQFFDQTLVDVAQSLANQGVRVILAGLDMDYLGRPFEPMPGLLSIAEYVTKKAAVCMQCGNPAGRSYRRARSEAQVMLGAAEAYEARCRRCFNEGERLQPVAAHEEEVAVVAVAG